MKRLILGLSAGLLFFMPLIAAAEVTDRIIAIVNDDIITLREVEKYAVVESKTRYSSVNEFMRNMQLRDKLDIFIEGLLISQQAKKMKIEVMDKEVEATIGNIKKQNLITEKELREQLKRENVGYKEFVDGIRRSLIRSRVIARAVAQELQMDEKRLKEYYDSHAAEYTENEYKLQHIFVSAQRKDGAERAQAAYTRLQKTELSFEDAAREYSDEPSRGEGGHIGYVKNAELIPELKQGIDLLVPGTYSHILKTGYGFHIVKLLEIKKGDPVPFEEMKGKIQEKMIASESEKRYKAYMAKLKSTAYIEVKI
jgi:peptidyl-prolyl cis-trans isomerase SurA